MRCSACSCAPGGALGGATQVLALLQSRAAHSVDLAPGSTLHLHLPWRTVQLPGYPWPLVLCSNVTQAFKKKK